MSCKATGIQFCLVVGFFCPFCVLVFSKFLSCLCARTSFLRHVRAWLEGLCSGFCLCLILVISTICSAVFLYRFVFSVPFFAFRFRFFDRFFVSVQQGPYILWRY